MSDDLKVRERWFSERMQQPDVLTAGASIGAFNAVAVLCRYPDAFGAAIGMSGTYRIERFYDEAWSQDLYFAAPLRGGGCSRSTCTS